MTEINKLAYGAKSIAKAVGMKPHTVYNLHRRNKNAPIHTREGIGLVCDPVELRAWLLGEHAQNRAPEEKR